MACVIVTAVEAAVVAIAAKAVEKKEKTSDGAKLSADTGVTETAAKIPFSKKLKWLRNMLAGGSALLIFEHVWHGEIVPWFPFLTAAGNPEDTAAMLNEMATVGVAMAVLVTVVWLGMIAVSAIIERRTQKALPVEG